MKKRAWREINNNVYLSQLFSKHDFSIPSVANSQLPIVYYVLNRNK